MHGHTRGHVVVTGNVWGPDRPYIHVPVKNFGRQVIFTLISSTVSCILIVGIV